LGQPEHGAIELGLQSSRRRIVLSVGQTQIIRLKGLGSAGYRWQTFGDPESSVIQIETLTEPLPKPPPYRSFSPDLVIAIRAIGQGETVTGCELVRPWSGQLRCRHEITVAVK
jgi:hypothetical protein